jgi:hypothetical protein
MKVELHVERLVAPRRTGGAEQLSAAIARAVEAELASTGERRPAVAASAAVTRGVRSALAKPGVRHR